MGPNNLHVLFFHNYMDLFLYTLTKHDHKKSTLLLIRKLKEIKINRVMSFRVNVSTRTSNQLFVPLPSYASQICV